MSADLTKRIETRTTRFNKLEPGDPYTIIDDDVNRGDPGQEIMLFDTIHGPGWVFKTRSKTVTMTNPPRVTYELTFIGREP